MVIVVIWRRLLFPCEDNWLYFGVWLISFISVPLLLYYLLKSNNVDEIRWFWTLIAILFFTIGIITALIGYLSLTYYRWYIFFKKKKTSQRDQDNTNHD